MGPAELLLIQLFMIGIPVGALGFFGWLGLRFVRARELDATHKLEGSVRSDELASLQDAVAALQAEVHAVRERQEFIEKLLDRPRSERPGQLPPG